jgi:hypothetical protein
MRQLKRIIVGHDLEVGGDVALRSAAVLAKRLSEALASLHFSLHSRRDLTENRSKTAGVSGKPGTR